MRSIQGNAVRTYTKVIDRRFCPGCDAELYPDGPDWDAGECTICQHPLSLLNWHALFVKRLKRVLRQRKPRGYKKG